MGEQPVSIPDPVPRPEPVTDTWNVRLVILFLGLIALAVVVGGQLLSALDKEVPVSIVALGSGAAGALGGILASTRGMRT